MTVGEENVLLTNTLRTVAGCTTCKSCARLALDRVGTPWQPPKKVTD